VKRLILLGTLKNPFWISAWTLAGLFWLIQSGHLRSADSGLVGQWIWRSQDQEGSGLDPIPHPAKMKPERKSGSAS
jgi:hypothetical protein